MPSSPDASLVLASASPRRRDLLTRAGVTFRVQPADVVEERAPGETPAAFAWRLAREKALAVASRLGASPSRWVLGADTIVVMGDDVLGKPRDPGHAEELLGRLLGREHRVLTAVAVVERDPARVHDARAERGPDRVHDTLVESQVRMREGSAEEVRAYVAGGEPLDKAGAYALQGEGRRFVERVSGSETNVIGLPLEETLALLRAAGWVEDP
jgi:septum formation protein